MADQESVNVLSRAHVSALRHSCSVRNEGGKKEEKMAKWRCQCPVSGSRLCTRWNLKTIGTSMNVSMPCLGLTSLHKLLWMKDGFNWWCVNALSRAHVSAPKPIPSFGCCTTVSMPCLGLTSLHPTPQKPQYLCGFQTLFFCVFFWIFRLFGTIRLKNGQGSDCVFKIQSEDVIRIYYTSIYLVRNMKAISIKHRFYCRWMPWNDSLISDRTVPVSPTKRTVILSYNTLLKWNTLLFLEKEHPFLC